MAAESGVPVDLYIYDLTHGLASVLSPAIIDPNEHPLVIGKEVDSQTELGRQVEGVWHTSVVVYGREYFYGGGGITSCAPGGTQLGPPGRVERVGETFVPFQVFVDYIQGLATTTYTGSAYRLLEHNCNHFSDEVLQFVCGARVPKHIVQQPDALPPPLRLALTALLDNLVPDAHAQVYAEGVRHVRHARQESPEYVTLNDQIEQARAAGAALGARRATLAEKLAKKERKEKKRNKHAKPVPDDMAEAVEMPTAVAAAPGPSSSPPSSSPYLDERLEAEQRRREADPPIVYRDIDGVAEFEAFATSLQGTTLSELDQQSLDELRQYLVLGEGSWVLGDDFLAFIGGVLRGGTESARVCCARCLCACALREDVSLLLHQDRRHHALLSHAHNIDRLPLPEQKAIALFMCNLFENISSSEWLLYISEWEADGLQLSNIRVTTKVCVHATLSEDAELRDVGTALMHNVATKEVFDEVSVELAMAVLQLLAWAPSEEHQYRALKALARLAAHSNDVPQLVAMLGPDPNVFKGTSPRVDEQIELLVKKLK